MFDMGFLELLLIGIIALIVLGPERLPKAARTVGLWIGKAKQGFDSIKTEIDRELKVKELQQQLAEEKAKLESEIEVDSGLSSIKDDFDQAVNSIHSEANSLSKELEDTNKNDSSETTNEALVKEPLENKKNNESS